MWLSLGMEVLFLYYPSEKGDIKLSLKDSRAKEMNLEAASVQIVWEARRYRYKLLVGESSKNRYYGPRWAEEKNVYVRTKRSSSPGNSALNKGSTLFLCLQTWKQTNGQ